jgi:hypothetical protein
LVRSPPPSPLLGLILAPLKATARGFVFFFIVLLFICAYKALVISPSCPHPSLTTHSTPTPSIPNRNYFALISNFVEESV